MARIRVKTKRPQRPQIALDRAGLPPAKRHTQIIVGNVLTALRAIPDRTVQSCITSPPYWALRDYGGEEEQLGLESTPQGYVDNMVKVFDEVHRVLRDDGTLWLNLGDSYFGDSNVRNNTQERTSHETPTKRSAGGNKRSAASVDGIKPKDLVGIPWMTAFALRNAGWYFRADIVWAKNVVMPEPVKDRPTSAHEFMFLFAKQRKYYYDQEAVREVAQGQKRGQPDIERNQRDVWNINPKPYKGAHFATFPTELVRGPIDASTSAKGACPECRAPWKRIVELVGGKTTGRGAASAAIAKKRGIRPRGGANYIVASTDVARHVTKGWEPTCECGHPMEDNIPCIVLDCFGGSGTTAMVANAMGRDAVLCELNATYAEDVARPRITKDAPFLNRVDILR